MRHPEDEMTDFRGDAAHVGEGTIHAWLDGALPASEAEALERHVAGCAACTAAVTEARGLVAASSRILGTLDAVPGGVLPAGSHAAPPTDADVRPLGAARPRARPRAWRRGPVQAAAAVALVALGTWSVVAREQPAASSVALDDRAARTEESAEAAPAPMPMSAADAGATAGGGAAASTSPRPREVAPGVAPDAGQRADARERAKAAERSPTPTVGVGASEAVSTDVPAAVTRPAEAVAFIAGAGRLEQRRVALAGADSVVQRPAARAPEGMPAAESGRAMRRAAAPAAPLPTPAPAPPPPSPPSAAVAAAAGAATAAPSVVGCYRAEVDVAAPAALRRALAEPLRLTDEAAGGGWRRVRPGARSAGGGAVARWRETDDRVVEVEWPAPTGPRLRLRIAADGLAGEAWLSEGGVPTAVTLGLVGCAGA